MKWPLLTLAFFGFSLSALSAVPADSVLQKEYAVPADSVSVLPNDTLAPDTQVVEQPRKLGLIRRIIRGFDRLDERYIEPQHYVFTVMLQSTYTYDYYTLRTSLLKGQHISFAHAGDIKVGPYIGWKWIFGGYSFTLGHSTYDKTKTEIDFSMYSSQIGFDFFYRRTGSDYRLRNIRVDDHVDTSPLDNEPFDGLQVGITGFNLYYIFNHGRFSYPAAFAQSTIQKISCGSWMAGFGYNRNSLEFDHSKLQQVFDEKLGKNTVLIDSGLMFNSARYYDINVSAGYAYNWVFARNWLFCACGQLALGYKQSSGDVNERSGMPKSFSVTKINPNLIGRFALVYNNMRWYAGFSAIVRSNTYYESRFSTTNTYGNMNLYVGYNFGLKKKYRNKD